MAEDGGDGGKAASPRRRRQAREEGHVARSREVVAAVVYAAALGVALLQGPTVWRTAQDELRAALVQPTPRAAVDFLQLLVPHYAAVLLRVLSPWLVTLMLAAVLGHWIQHGPLWLPTRILPNAQRIDPGLVFVRMGRSGAGGRLLLGVFKCAVLAVIAIRMTEQLLPRIVLLGGLTGSQLMPAAGRLFMQIAAWLGLGVLLTAAIDFAWQLWRYERELSMSPEEVREEVKAVRNDVSDLRRR